MHNNIKKIYMLSIFMVIWLHISCYFRAYVESCLQSKYQYRNSHLYFSFNVSDIGPIYIDG